MIALVNIGGEMQELETAWWVSLWIVLCLIILAAVVVGAVVNRMSSERGSRREVYRLSDARDLRDDVEFDPGSAKYESSCEYFGEHCYGSARDGLEQCDGCGHVREAHIKR